MLQYALSTLASVTQSEHAFRHQMAAVSFTFHATLPLVCTGTQPPSERCAPYGNSQATKLAASKGRFRVCTIVLDKISSLAVPQFNYAPCHQHVGGIKVLAPRTPNLGTTNM